MAPLGFDPRTIDTMEVWEAASILRRYEDTGDDDTGDGPSVIPRAGERDLVAERMAYAAALAAHERGEGPHPGPKPRPDPPRPDTGGGTTLDRVNAGASVSE